MRLFCVESLGDVVAHSALEPASNLIWSRRKCSDPRTYILSAYISARIFAQRVMSRGLATSCVRDVQIRPLRVLGRSANLSGHLEIRYWGRGGWDANRILGLPSRAAAGCLGRRRKCGARKLPLFVSKRTAARDDSNLHVYFRLPGAHKCPSFVSSGMAVGPGA